jgi:hypothetical protein
METNLEKKAQLIRGEAKDRTFFRPDFIASPENGNDIPQTKPA